VNLLAKIGAVIVMAGVVLAGIMMAIGKTVAWVSGGLGLSSGVQAGTSLVVDGEWVIGLMATAIVLAVLAWHYISRNGGGGGI
jgi:hypothetical protein